MPQKVIVKQDYHNSRFDRWFKANIINSGITNGKEYIELDSTFFYPEGGGQPSDKGTINDISVLDVQKVDNKVLHFIKYGESSVITTIFTRDFGRQSYMVNASRNRKSKNKAGLLQPLFLVDIEAVSAILFV